MSVATRRLRVLLAALACSTAACRGCLPSPQEPTPPSDGAGPAASLPSPDILLVTLDTVRADRIGAWGHDRARTPTLDALASVGRRYDRALSPVPLTLPSHATILTGLEPWNHGVRSNGDHVLDPSITTLAEHLRSQGYATGAAVGAFVLTRRWGLDQGFDHYDDTLPVKPGSPWGLERRGDEVVDAALDWLATVSPDRPRMLWVHLYDAHHPWMPPQEFLDPADPRPYDGEIAWVDHQVGRLLPAFDERPAVIAVVADHGESLGEHDELEHGLFVYDATQHVPWILVGPGVRHEVIPQPVPLSDVAPVVLDAAGLPPMDGIDGVVDAPADRVVSMGSWSLSTRFGTAPHLAVVKGPHKLLATPVPQLFDVVADPAETTNVLTAHREVARALVDAIPPGLRTPPESGAVDPSIAARLAALGYVTGTPDDALDRPDPSTRRALIRAVGQVDRHVAVGEPDQAVRILAGLEADWPDVLELPMRRSSLLARHGRAREALSVVQAAQARFPGESALAMREAALWMAVGEPAKAADRFEALASDPENSGARTLAVSTRRGLDPAAAVALGRRLAAAHPQDAALAGAVGVALVVAGEPDEATPWLARGVSADPPASDVHWTLADRALAAGDLASALQHAESEVRHHPTPDRAAAWTGLAVEARDWKGVRRAAEAWSVNAPEVPEAWHARALAAFNLGRHDEAREAVDAGLALAPAHPLLVRMDANLLAETGDEEAARQRAAEVGTP